MEPADSVVEVSVPVITLALVTAPTTASDERVDVSVTRRRTLVNAPAISAFPAFTNAALSDEETVAEAAVSVGDDKPVDKSAVAAVKDVVDTPPNIEGA